MSQLWGRASKKAKADQGALPALPVLLAGIRQAIGEKTKDARFETIVDLVRRYDAGDLKPVSIAARQRALLVKQIHQIRPLLKSLVGLDSAATSSKGSTDRFNSGRARSSSISMQRQPSVIWQYRRAISSRRSRATARDNTASASINKGGCVLFGKTGK